MSDRSNLIITKSSKEKTKPTDMEIGLNYLISKNFFTTDEVNAKKWFVYSNLRKFKPSMDESIWKQLNGQLPEICEIYWNGEYICEVSYTDDPWIAIDKIKYGFTKMVRDKQLIKQRKEQNI